ncbi:helix-turn-helix domain-containing protein [Streptacidiphilus sp. 4-A2]|nr:helix-turn-helix domain-containing protein [Streptacidiphilus sp. 4-A2]
METQLTARTALGRELRNLRLEYSLTTEDVAVELGCHSTLVSRIETGKRACQPDDFETLMRLYRVKGSELTRLRALLKRGISRKPPWYAPYRDVVSSAYAEFIDFETAATKVREYQTVLPPGLTQTEAVAEVLTSVGSSVLSPDQVEVLVEVRMRRQRRIQAAPLLACEFVITEAVLRFQIGGPETWLAQLKHMRALCDLEHVDLRVVPFAAGANATQTGSYSVFEFAGEDDPDVAFVETVMGSVRKDGPTELRRLNRLFARIQAAALPPEASADLIDRIIVEGPL